MKRMLMGLTSYYPIDRSSIVDMPVVKEPTYISEDLKDRTKSKRDEVVNWIKENGGARARNNALKAYNKYDFNMKIMESIRDSDDERIHRSVYPWDPVKLMKGRESQKFIKYQYSRGELDSQENERIKYGLY